MFSWGRNWLLYSIVNYYFQLSSFRRILFILRIEIELSALNFSRYFFSVTVDGSAKIDKRHHYFCEIHLVEKTSFTGC